MTKRQGRVILVAGATGLVGQEIVAALLSDKTVKLVYCLGRRSSGVKHAKLSELMVDFGSIPALPQIDECFIALGTTIKTAGSKDAFRAVDLTAVLNVAVAAQAAGAKTFGVVSAMGANARSRVFYNRIKGEMELALTGLGLESVTIARPSLLKGNRKSLGQTARAGEFFGLLMSRGLGFFLPANYRAILAKDVAYALIRSVQVAKPGVTTLMSGEMQGG